MSYDSIVNRSEYLSAHYLAEVLPKELKKKDALPARWTERQKAGQPNPPAGLRALRKAYDAERKPMRDFRDKLAETPESVDLDERRVYQKSLRELHGDVLRALGFAAAPRKLEVMRADRPHAVQVAHAEQSVVAIECGWATEVDAALDPEQAGALLDPVQLDNRNRIATGTKLATWLLTDESIRYVLILAGGVIVLADRAAWGEGRYLAVSLDIALDRRNDRELEMIAALFSADVLLPPEEGGSEPLAELIAGSRKHAVGVSTELREGLRQSVEIIANEMLARLDQAGVRPADIMEPAVLAKELGRQSLRYLYRILFLLYAEARPELGILPADHPEYAQGYGLARLGDLVVRDLVGEDARNSFHLSESLDLLFRLVNDGHRERSASAEAPSEDPKRSEDESIRFEPLRADLFDPKRTWLIGRDALVKPGYDEDDPDAPRIDTRLRNSALYRVLRLLMLTRGKKKERGGFISYAQLGINQLGAVYEGLMSYTGFIADEVLYEVAKNGDPKDGSWMISESQVKSGVYQDDVFVPEKDEDGNKTGGWVHYPKGKFVYRLAGRDRQTSASYYTPESLTQVTVQLALQHRLDQNGTTTTAREILGWTICEPALGSGAFLNEAINQVAAEYLKRRQKELGVSLDPERHAAELQKAKAYIALHNSYGVDLNETAVELAEVSIWLNVMHPGLQAPWFGLHLRRGNSLIGAGRRLYAASALVKGEWLKTAPEDHPLSAGPIPEGHIHHFLLPAEGWGAVAGEKEAKSLAPDDASSLGKWRMAIRTPPSKSKKGKRKLSQIDRLQALSRRAEYLWTLVQDRLALSEKEIRRQINVWGAGWIEHPQEAIPKEKVYGDLVAPGTPYWRLKKVMDAWCALWFWPLDGAPLLNGSDQKYQRAVEPVAEEAQPPAEAEEPESIGLPVVYEMESLFGESPKQLSVGSVRPSRPKSRILADPLRPVIPLVSLDDWLDFAEALLGRQDIPPDSLAGDFTNLGILGEYEDKLDSQFFMNMEPWTRLKERFPWLDTVDDIAKQQGFFHWELYFSQVFQRGGFDLQVGNPPWVQPVWSEAGALAESEPWFKLADKVDVDEWARRKETVLSRNSFRVTFSRDLEGQLGAANFYGSPIEFAPLRGTQPDLYRCFIVKSWANSGLNGIAALIHYDTHFSGTREGGLRASTYARLRFHAHFYNRTRIFIDPDPNTEFGVNVYGSPRPTIGFTHPSWLFDAATLSGSLVHDGRGDLPGIKHSGTWDKRPHKARLIWVDGEVLTQWRSLTADDSTPLYETALRYPVTNAEQGVIAAMIRFKQRLVSATKYVSDGYHESGSKKARLIREEVANPGNWSEVILDGPQIAVATPIAKQPPRTGNGDPSTDLTILAADAVPTTGFVRVADRCTFLDAQDKWGHSSDELLESDNQQEPEEPNVTPGFLDHIGRIIERPISGDDLLAYIAATVAHPGYTRRYRKDLAVPGIRIPLSRELRIWERAIELGRQIVWLHTLGRRFTDPDAGRPEEIPPLPATDPPQILTPIPYTTADMPDQVRYDEHTQTLLIGAAGRIAPVPSTVWKYTVAGMPVVSKWIGYRLKYPRGRPPATPLDTINATSWTQAFNDDLMNLLNTLSHLVRLEPAQEALLNELCSAALITVTELHDAQVLPPPKSSRSLTSRKPPGNQMSI
jgi:hypothetical protein